MLKNLMGVYHVERAVRVIQLVNVAHGEGHIADALPLGVSPGRLERHRFVVDAHHVAGCHHPGELDNDGARTAADIQYLLARPQARDQISGGIVDRPPAV
jgi:hypothetical protein